MMGMVLFTKLPANADYLGHVLPGLVVTGLGLGLIFAPATASATAGIEPRDAGAASALVNTSQQIGGSMGTALLNTIAVIGDVAGAIAWPSPRPTRLPRRTSRAATLHGYAVAFWWAAVSSASAPSSPSSCSSPGVPELEGDLGPADLLDEGPGVRRPVARRRRAWESCCAHEEVVRAPASLRSSSALR